MDCIKKGRNGVTFSGTVTRKAERGLIFSWTVSRKVESRGFLFQAL